MIIILFNMGLYKTVLSTYSFRTLVCLCLSTFFVFFACSEFDVIFINFCNFCIIITYLVDVMYSVFWFSLLTSHLNNLWEQIHVIKTWLKLLLKNMPPGSFYKNLIKALDKKHASRELWALKFPFIKKNVKHLHNERV